jgi:hypothetical protein
MTTSYGRNMPLPPTFTARYSCHHSHPTINKVNVQMSNNLAARRFISILSIQMNFRQFSKFDPSFFADGNHNLLWLTA